MHKAMVLVLLRQTAESQREINFENNIKDFIEDEIWQREHSKNLRDWFSKAWLPCDTLYFIFDAYAILIQSSNELALVQFTIVGFLHCQHFYADHGMELEMLEFI